MELSAQQHVKVINHLNAHWPNHTCEVCGTNSWAMYDRLVEIHQYGAGPLVLPGLPIITQGAIYPFVAMTCKKCGNTKFFNAVALGVVDKPEGAEGTGGLNVN